MEKSNDYAGIYDYGHRLLIKFIEFENSGTIFKNNCSGKFSELIKEYERLLQMIELILLEVNETKLQLANMKEINKIKSNFYDDISHELRIPLTLMIGSLNDIQSHYLSMEQRQKIELIMQNVYRMLYLINQLVELSGLCTENNTLYVCRRNIVPFLKGIFYSLEILFREHELQFVFNSIEDEIYLYFDMEKLEKVFLNIIINAIKFTPMGGKVFLTIKRIGLTAEQIEIVIADTGLGISKENLVYVFDRFFQYRNANEDKPVGTIIGLTIAKYLIELHHGKLDIKSNLGKGTIITIQLPVKDSFNAIQTVEVSETLSPTNYVHLDSRFLGREKRSIVKKHQMDSKAFVEKRKSMILVIEYHNDIRNYIKEILQPFYQVIEAEDTEEGMHKAVETIPDLIISDVIPGIDSYEFCSKLKKNIQTSHIPLILLTAQAAEESIIKGLESGVDDYIIQPFNSNILRQRIENLINLRTLLKETFQQRMHLQVANIPASDFMTEIEQVLEKKISNPEFNVEELSQKLCMDRTTIYRKLRALTGQSPTDFIRSYRLMRAAELLKNNSAAVVDIALEVGFSSASYFTKCFKKEFKVLPSDFRFATKLSFRQ